MTKVRGKTVEVACKCGTMFTARMADRKRGWAKSCSKSCAAKKRDNSAYFKMKRRQRDAEEFGGMPQYNNRGEYEGFVRTSIEPWDDHKS